MSIMDINVDKNTSIRIVTADDGRLWIHVERGSFKHLVNISKKGKIASLIRA